MARVVKAGSSPFFVGVESRKEGKSSKPAMLQTTAAVHPGGSGGAVVNGEGRLIGLVTRYEPRVFNSRIQIAVHSEYVHETQYNCVWHRWC